MTIATSLKDYTIGANLVLSAMGELTASEDDMRCFFEAGLPADGAADDFAYYRKEAQKQTSVKG